MFYSIFTISCLKGRTDTAVSILSNERRLKFQLLFVHDTTARKLESYHVTKQSASRQLTCVMLRSFSLRMLRQLLGNAFDFRARKIVF